MYKILSVGELTNEQEKYKGIIGELDATYSEMTGY